MNYVELCVVSKLESRMSFVVWQSQMLRSGIEPKHPRRASDRGRTTPLEIRPAQIQETMCWRREGGEDGLYDFRFPSASGFPRDFVNFIACRI